MKSWLIGSAPDCDIVVKQQAVSGHHCRLTKAVDGFLLEDLSSTNGTFVNGERITEVRRVVRADTITLGLKTPMPWPNTAMLVPVVEPAETKPEEARITESVEPVKKSKFMPFGILGLLAALGLLALLAVLGWMWWTNRDEPVAKDPVEVTDPVDPNQDFIPEPVPETEPKAGFQMGSLEPEVAIDRIDVTIAVGGDGADLEEPVDLHLGLGFPLRLYPVGSEERDPAFAAFPQTTSIPPGETAVAAGTSASFRFLAKQQADQGQDILHTTPPLLTDVRVADIQRIGFGCEGESPWILEGYEIEINGQLYASNDSVNTAVLDRQEENRFKLKEMLTEAEPLALQVMQGEAYTEAQLATEEDKADLAQAKQQLAALEDPINLLRGQSEGIYPWYIEDNESFKPSKPQEATVGKVAVKLLTSGDERSGSNNSIYLKARGHKYLLASRIDPLASDPEFQEFTIPRDALNFDPITRTDLKPSEIGIGMLGNDDPFDRIPDRANVQRVVVEVDDKEVYDSEKNVQDRSTLATISLIPPVHRDNVGFPVENPSSPYEVYLWKTGMPLPEAEKIETPPEPKPIDEGDDDQDADDKKKEPKNKDEDKNKDDPKKKDDKNRKKQRPFNSRRRPSFPLIVINFPIIGGGVRGIPGPTLPVITNVRIDPGNSRVQFGRSCHVEWNVVGNTFRVSSFRVRLYPVLPHRTSPFLNPVANELSNNRGSRRFKITPQTNSLRPTEIAVNERPFLYVRPEVTALDARGRGIAGATGPILPIFPAGRAPLRLSHASPAPGANNLGVLGIAPVQFLPANPDTNNPVFAVFPTPPSWPFASQIIWPATQNITNNDPGFGNAVWAIQPRPGQRFASYPLSSNAKFAHNIALRPSNDTTRLAIQFRRLGINAPERLVAHAGFVTPGSGAAWNNTARIHVEVKVFDAGTTALIRWVATNTPLTVTRNTLTRTSTLINIPVAGPADPGPPGPFGTKIVPGPSNPPNLTYVYPVPATVAYGDLNSTKNTNVSVSIMISQARTTTNPGQAIGIFGVRLVP